MTRKVPELSVGAAFLATLAIVALAVAWVGPWYEYDDCSGRQTAPDGAYSQDEDGVVRRHLEYGASGWSGDVEPDQGLADRLAWAIPLGIGIAAVALLLVALGEVPAIHRVIHRRVALALVAVALAAIAATAVLAWQWMPESMEAHLVSSQFDARLHEPQGLTGHEDEPSGYTSANLLWGWHAIALAAIPALGAGLFKFGAGKVDLDAVTDLLTRPEEA